jgi:2-polyprenyl-6-hydroxyphenyl methylase/3-demethylubiquinone-9 3-methyltransferase
VSDLRGSSELPGGPSHADSVEEYFDQVADSFGRNYQARPDFLERRDIWQRAVAASLTRLTDGGICLDLGCGDGTLSRPVAAKGIQTVGIDQSERMLSAARRLAAEAGVGRWTLYLRASLPLPDDVAGRYVGKAGLILCSSVLEYVPDYEKALAQCFGMLKPGGRLLLSIPNRGSVYRIVERAGRSLFSLVGSYLRHQRHQFNVSELEALLERMGYLVSGRTFFALPLPRVSEKIFGRYRGRWLATMVLLVADKPALLR